MVGKLFPFPMRIPGRKSGGKQQFLNCRNSTMKIFVRLLVRILRISENQKIRQSEILKFRFTDKLSYPSLLDHILPILLSSIRKRGNIIGPDTGHATSAEVMMIQRKTVRCVRFAENQ